MLEARKIPEEAFQRALTSPEATLYRKIDRSLGGLPHRAALNLNWLYANMHPYFFITMKQEIDAIINLCSRLQDVATQRTIVLIDEDKKLIVARLDVPGSLYNTLKTLEEREISYAEMSHSNGPIPGVGKDLEIQRFEFDRRSSEEIGQAGAARVPAMVRKAILDAIKRHHPGFDLGDLDRCLRILWLNNSSYVRISPPERVARALWVYQQGRRHDGLYLDVEEVPQVTRYKETRVLFSVGNPPQRGFLTQVGEVFQRLGIGVRRSYSLIINTGLHPYFLSSFYVTPHDGTELKKDSELYRKLKSELYNTQILNTASPAYRDLATKGATSGEEASLTNAFMAFCHTTLAHNRPDRFDLQTVTDAFHANPAITRKLLDLFSVRFAPGVADRQETYEQALGETSQAIGEFSTGHHYLDEIRRSVFRTCLSLIRHTLKTNFCVPEKHAFSFRLDPAYLTDLGPEFTSDLPEGTPFRITFFYSRHALGYHIGFSDIARGGWRTVICRDHDAYVTNTNNLFREVFVLAHTQHLKNKDIYEGGSKLTVVLDARDVDSPSEVNQRLYKAQYGVINAFLDIFVTEGGVAKSPEVVDYYRQDEPIELGPDENMHSAMIETVARQAVRRGYPLGIGIISSKEVGIHHKEYGVTSRGVLKFAEIAMREIGVDIHKDPFDVKFTGGTNGDVAGNAIGLILDRCPRARIRCIVDGTAGLFDPEGADRSELAKLVLRDDLDRFHPWALHPGGVILYRGERRLEGLRELYRRVSRTPSGVEEGWVTTDEFHREIDNLTFEVPTDLFLPCGGRPETVDKDNLARFFPGDGKATARVIIEGANSFITPEAREVLQKRGVILIRDASANKCGVISSSYEIIANLLMTEKEFVVHKDRYVKDVIEILERRASDEANLIFQRHREAQGRVLYTDISRAISVEINERYARLFSFFQKRTQWASEPFFQRIVLTHLPAILRETPEFRGRVKEIPPKIQFAILASEIASSRVYHAKRVRGRTAGTK